jgi:hypothetical protein
MPTDEVFSSPSETPNAIMEVHHHPDTKHKRKSWKEYFLECLMIFIAVSMGFIAENIREGITNREHVHDLVTQLVQDLKNDTAQLNDIFKAESEISLTDDSLIELSQRPLSEINADHLQKLLIQAHSLWPFHPSGGATAAIKNELHLKQFSGSDIIGLIANFDKHVELLQTVQEITLQYQRSYIDPFLLKHFTTASLHAGFNRIPGIPADCRNLSQDELTQLGSGMVFIGINTQELIKTNQKLRNDALSLLRYVKDRYDLNE